MAGLKLRQRLRLAEVWGPAPEQRGLLRSYPLACTPSTMTGRSLLTEVRTCEGSGVCLRPTRFTWSEGRPEFEVVNTYITDLTGSTRSARAEGLRALHLADVDGEGRSDLLYREFVDDGRGGYGRWWVRLSRGHDFGPRQPAGLPEDTDSCGPYAGRLLERGGPPQTGCAPAPGRTGRWKWHHRYRAPVYWRG